MNWPRQVFQRILHGSMLTLACFCAAAINAQTATAERRSTFQAVEAEAKHTAGQVGAKVSGDTATVPGPSGSGGTIFRETVAIVGTNTNRLLCTGVLIDRDVVLTAAHCVCAWRGNRNEIVSIGFGRDRAEWSAISRRLISIDDERTVFFQADQAFCRDYQINPQRAMFGKDFALLFLQKSDAETKLNFLYGGYEAGDGQRTFLDHAKQDRNPQEFRSKSYDVAPARIATAALYLAPSITRLIAVGYGRSDADLDNPAGTAASTGFKLFAPLTIRSKICGHPLDRAQYGCAAGREAVLIDPVSDTCAGDSGGPVFVLLPDRYFLVGITSRGLAGRSCVKGGIYSLITPDVIAWMRLHGVTLHSTPYPEQ
ncbi:MAG: trypsin-like serine protease [Pseudomonadota bacterium]